MNDEELDTNKQDVIVDSCLYREVELHTNCTVQILENVATGELSIGWWRNE